jgi:hypothetical protein
MGRLKKLNAPSLWWNALLTAAAIGAFGALAEAILQTGTNWRVLAAVALAGALRGMQLHMAVKPEPKPRRHRRYEEHERGESMLPALAALLMLLTVVIVGRLCFLHGRAVGFELGLLKTATDIAIPPGPARDLPAELDAHFVATESLVQCREALAQAEDQAAGCGASIEFAEQRAAEKWYALGRDDWKLQPWECR